MLAPHHRPDNLGPETDEPIPFNLPFLSGKEIGYIADAVFRGTAASGGHYARRCQHLLSELLEGAPVLLTTSCTHALEMAALLLDIRPGDEVIVPSFTFVSTANAFVLRGARTGLRRRPSRHAEPRRGAARSLDHPAHQGDRAGALRRGRLRDGRDRGHRGRHGVAVVEDNAHGLLATYKGRPLGTLRRAGDAQLPRDEELHVRRGRRARGQRPRSTWSGPRSSARRAPTAAGSSAARSTSTPGSTSGRATSPAEMLAAYLCAQLESREHDPAEPAPGLGQLRLRAGRMGR